MVIQLELRAFWNDPRRRLGNQEAIEDLLVLPQLNSRSLATLACFKSIEARRAPDPSSIGLLRSW